LDSDPSTGTRFEILIPKNPDREEDENHG
jgi:hypothetical protein